MGANSVVVVVVSWLALLDIRALCQCPELTEPILEGLTVDLIGNQQSEGEETVTSVNLNNFKVNCLAAAETRGYEEATVTVSYTADTGSTGTGQMLLDCSSSATWNLKQGLDLPREIDGMTVTAETLLVSETDASCTSCSPTQSSINVPSYCTGGSNHSCSGVATGNSVCVVCSRV